MTDNHDVKSKRTMNYFIEATLDIIREKGIDGVTIREVAKRSGYTSGSIYRYFDSVDELIGFAGVRSLVPVTGMMNEIDTGKEDPFEVFYIITYIELLLCTAYSEIYYDIMEKNHILAANYFDKYYEVFPEDKVEITERVSNTFFSVVKRDADYIILDELVESGVFSKADMVEVNNTYDVLVIGAREWHQGDPRPENIEFLQSVWKKFLLGHNPELRDDLVKYEARAKELLEKYKDQLK
jgi:AcrR family transcriptional regulator